MIVLHLHRFMQESECCTRSKMLHRGATMLHRRTARRSAANRTPPEKTVAPPEKTVAPPEKTGDDRQGGSVDHAPPEKTVAAREGDDRVTAKPCHGTPAIRDR